ncbi:MAG: MFS transporter [Gammaproteobacteria bacterium]|nr:MFS transporter [Gammaproteobacteria bacterium]
MNTSTGATTDSRRLYVLLMLLAVYTLNFLDRQILSILAIPVKADLGLSDTQLGLLGGTAFALFYSTLGIPVALLADRYSRTRIMMYALLLWSVMTAACGMAQGFWQLFMARLGVGIGESGGVAPAHSLISDYFPSHQRARALAVYSFGVPIGIALSMLLGGAVSTATDWRYAFIIVGLAGVIVAPIFRFTVAEPPRGRYDASAALPPARLKQIWATLAGKRSYWLVGLGAVAASVVGYGIIFWLPSLVTRSYGLELLDTAFFMAALFLIGGTAGLWLGGMLVDRYGRNNRAVYALLPAAAFALSAPLYAVGIMAPSAGIAFVVLLLPTGLGLAWLGPVLAAVQHLVRADMRVTAAAILIFKVNLVGLGLGTAVLGALSDALTVRFGDNGLRYALLASLLLYFVAAILMWRGARYLADDWQE